ncbi:MAG TPA: NlpC/P60 family protein, partial [Prosthecobacter sp.]|nr:NlpC/P60 family protein [Prosthecobacter sp.]
QEEEEVLEGPDSKGAPKAAAVSTINVQDLAAFEHYAPQIQQLVRNALDLTKLNLTYTFGSSNPSQGGMDCSGTIFHLLQGLGIKGVPRQSDDICRWVQNGTLLHRIDKADSLTHPEFSALQPGDLLFWSGTYSSVPREIPVTHVMIYLGKMKKGGKHVVFGSSDGRVYQGQRRTGVSVFDFTLPKAGSKSSFYGYGLIPGIGKARVKPLDPVTIAAATVNKVAPPVKEPLEAKDGIAPLKTDVAVTPAKEESTPPQEEIRRAAPSVAATSSETANQAPAVAAKPTAKKKSKAGTATKSKAAGSSKSKRPASKRESSP